MESIKVQKFHAHKIIIYSALLTVLKKMDMICP